MMGQLKSPVLDVMTPEARNFYCQVLEKLNEEGVPYLLGGAYALGKYTGISRHTKDLDIFAHERDREGLFRILTDMKFHVDPYFSHWLGKAVHGEDCVDVVFGAANGIATVDDLWFQHAVKARWEGIPVLLCPPEETIWSKGFVMDRYRYDGADIAHLIRAWDRLDWKRLLWRFEEHWQVLLNHLILFTFVYPGERSRVPQWLMDELVRRLIQQTSQAAHSEKLCCGVLLDGRQYQIDLDLWGYHDPRLRPQGSLSRQEVKNWTMHLESEQH
jgi:hypothetical protein